MSNPLLVPSTVPYGLPDFPAITVDDYREAFEAGVAEQLDELATITANPEPPTFENTVLALEGSGRTLGLAVRVLDNIVGSDGTDDLLALDEELAPRFAEHMDRIVLDADLFGRISAVRDAMSEGDLDDESRRLVDEHWRTMQLAGAGLDDEAKQRLRELNQELSTLGVAFHKNLLGDTAASAVLFTDAAELDGLDDDQLSTCAQAASERGLEGWLVTLPLFSDHPFQALLTNRESRRRLYEASVARGNRGNEFDNNDVVRRTVALRAERAQLLGYESHAAAMLANQTIGGVEDVHRVVYPLAAPAMTNLRREAAALQGLIDATLGDDRYDLQPWDWSFWTERLREQRYAVDTTALREHFELDRVLVDGVFWAATQLYGITFTPRPDVTTHVEGARAFEVRDADGSAIGLFIHDAFARDTKRGGAWMNNLVEQNHLFGELPVVLNTLNIPRPVEGRPALLTLDEVTTMFHEFGHALHGLLSNATYPSLAGTQVPRDFVEYPSQVNEMWWSWPEVIEHYGRHHVTGEGVDKDLLARMEESSTFNEGFMTVEYLAAALLDFEWHSLPAGTVVEDVQAFERDVLERVGLANDWVVPRYRSTYFSHVFAGGYSAGYYSYINAEVLDADTVEWFKENGGLRRANGDVFRAELLSRGNTRDPMESFRTVRGRDADITPLLKRRGLA